MISTPAILNLLQELYRFQSVSSLSENVCRRLPELLGGENAMICRHDGPRKIITSVVARHPFSCANLMPQINESGIMGLHPFWDNVFDERQPVRSISDLMPRTKWKAHPLYDVVFAPDGIEDQLNMEIGGDRAAFTTLNLMRARRGFTVEERELFGLLRPHLNQAFTNAALAERVGLVPGQHDLGWTLLLDARGGIAPESEGLMPSLEVRFSRGGRFHANIEDWIAGHVIRLNQGLLESALTPRLFTEGGIDYVFTLHRAYEHHGYRLIIKRVDSTHAHQALSPREEEILRWVAEGKSNDEVAIILGMSVNTVKTHLKRSFKKLGVENRTAAVAAWPNPFIHSAGNAMVECRRRASLPRTMVAE